MQAPLFHKDKQIFGLDFGRSTVKIVQLAASRKQPRVVGYGYADFDASAIDNGVIVDTEAIAKVVKPLIKNIVIGDLTTDRAVANIPTAHVYSRTLELSGVEGGDLASAVELEAQQYVPLKSDERYLDFEIIDSGNGDDQTRVFMVAAPRTIVDSYLELFSQLGIEIYGTEPSLLSIVRAVNHATGNSQPKIVIDFGSQSSDLAIYDRNVRLTSTASMGGDHITDSIAKTLKVDEKKAREIKSRYGISSSKWQKQLAPALSPILTSLAEEVQKLLRYHHDHVDAESSIEQIVIAGGGANLPGLDSFLSHLTGISVITCNPWDNIRVKPLQPPHKLETSLYTTAVGLALQELER